MLDVPIGLIWLPVAERRFFPRVDGTVALPDGRRIGFAEFGASSGPVVFVFHAGMSSRLDACWADEAAARLGIRVIGLDRPGIGRSEPKRGRRLVDWADDVSAVADALCADRFAVVGWSSGGAYALAVAAAIPDRLLGVGLLAGLAPIGVRPMARFDRSFLFIARRAPILLRMLGVTVAWMLGRILAHGSPPRGSARVVGEADASIVAALGPGLLLSFREAFRAGSQGVLDDEVLVIEPWGFELNEVRPVVQLWQGDADRFAPPVHARRLAEFLPRVVLHECPGEGHFLAYGHAAEILESLFHADCATRS